MDPGSFNLLVALGLFLVCLMISQIGRIGRIGRQMANDATLTVLLNSLTLG
jgi:hypothetical protein